MKIKIRRGLFETNSSSTHSLQVVQGDLQTAKDFVYKRIMESYENYSPDEDTDEDAFIVENKKHNGEYTVNLLGLDFKDGNEERNCYSIVTKWDNKLRYIAGLLYAYRRCTKEHREYWDWFYDKWGRNSWNENYNVNPEYMKDLNNDPNYFNSSVAKKYLEFVKEYVKNKTGKNVTEVVYLDEYDCYVDESNYFDDDLIQNEDALFERIKYFMHDDVVMIYADEAYNPYELPDIKIM